MKDFVLCFAPQFVFLQFCTGHCSAEAASKDRCGVLQRDSRAAAHRDSQSSPHVRLIHQSLNILKKAKL